VALTFLEREFRLALSDENYAIKSIEIMKLRLEDGTEMETSGVLFSGSS
jgi:hypothetical protein